jgi:GNAT superfamily N-acetyltransferase
MGLLLTRDVEGFAARAQAFLAERVERNVLATVLHTVREHGGFGAALPLFAIESDEETGGALAVAIRTPPWPLLAAGFDESGTAGELLEAWLELDPRPPGVSAEPATARAISAAFVQLTGGISELEFDEAMHVLTSVTPPPRPAAGTLRPAAGDDRPVLLAWEYGFLADARMGDPAHAEAALDRRLAAGFQYVWSVEGAIVCTVAHNLPIARTVRIGPVYTPPKHRGRGYASSAVAALSRLLLDTSAHQCMLLTDLANPTSNKIYASVGYERSGDWEQYRFSRL